MTYSPQTWLDVRAVFRRETGLPNVSLGIQHFSPQGGGYHEGNDLLAAAGRLNTDYSKRETDRDRPGTDGANAIDIGWFDVWVTRVDGSVVRVTLRTLSQWLLNNWNAPDALWLREMIYSLDGQTVKRKDRLGIRTSGDDSHLTHDHLSGFRDEENTPKAPLFERFWREMKGQQTGGSSMAGILDDPAHANRMAYRIEALTQMLDNVADSGNPAEENKQGRALKRIESALVTLSSAFTVARDAEIARDALLHAAVQTLASGGTSIDTAAVINAINAKASEIIEATRQQELDAAQAAVDALND